MLGQIKLPFHCVEVLYELETSLHEEMVDSVRTVGLSGSVLALTDPRTFALKNFTMCFSPELESRPSTTGLLCSTKKGRI